MAGQGGRSSLDLKLDLLKQGHAFSFFQVIRLLRLFAPMSDKTEGTQASQSNHIRIRPHLSLAFPPADVDSIEELGDEAPRFLVTATLLGLYGPSSPLPTFYTEELMDEAAEDESVTRDFVDIVNHRLFLLLFRCWTKYRLFIQIVEDRNSHYLERLFSLLGLGGEVLRKDVRDPYALLRYIGLFTQFPRSAVGLACLLQDALGSIPVQVLSCIERRAKIPSDQRIFLGRSGGLLGMDSYLGEEMVDRMGKFRLQVGPVNREAFQALLPGGEDCEKLSFLTKLYVTDALEYDVELTLAEGEAQGVYLGSSEWSRLGWDSWLLAGEESGEVKTIFYPE